MLLWSIATEYGTNIKCNQLITSLKLLLTINFACSNSSTNKVYRRLISQHSMSVSWLYTEIKVLKPLKLEQLWCSIVKHSLSEISIINSCCQCSFRNTFVFFWWKKQNNSQDVTKLLLKCYASKSVSRVRRWVSHDISGGLVPEWEMVQGKHEPRDHGSDKWPSVGECCHDHATTVVLLHAGTCGVDVQL